MQTVSPSTDFEATYLSVRDKENRLYNDQEVWQFPQTFSYNLHKEEWQMRARGLDRFMNYLYKRTDTLACLDVGCGNGWFSHHISTRENTHVYGIDVNLLELEQGARVFSRPNLTFVYGDIFQDGLPLHSFDIITFNSSIQYFASIDKVVKRCFEYLKPGGEIHILDTPIYKRSHLEKAQKRTEEYYEELGFEEMAKHYYHHAAEDFRTHECTYLYNPSSPIKWFQRNILQVKDSPFPWIRINK